MFMPSSKKKVIHFIDSGGLYGAESVILNLSREMLLSGEYTPVIGCIVPDTAMHNDLYNESRSKGLMACKIKIRNLLLWLDLPRAARTIHNMGVDLIHCHGYKAFVFAFLIGKWLRIPVVSTCHLWFLEGYPPLKMRLMIKLELFFYNFVPVIVGVSIPIKGFLTSAGISADKIKIINNGIPVHAYQTVDRNHINRLRSELGLTQNEFVVINVGRLSLQKDHKTILRAAKTLKEANSHVRILIVGDGELRAELEEYILKHQIEHTVKILGFRKDIKGLLNIASVFLLPSLDEGMPISLLEAAASNTPIITTMVGDIPKMIHHEESGLAVPVGNPSAIADAIIRLKNSFEMQKKIKTKAFETLISQYSSEHMYKEYKKVYEMLL